MASKPQTSESASQELFSFAHGLEFEDCPPAAIEMARNCIIDTVGVMLAGVPEDAARIVREHVDSFAPQGQATAIGHRQGFSLQHAALINGVQGHALDYDDVSYYTFGFHPSVTIVPTLLAAAEHTGTTGKELLTTFVAAFELEIRIPGGIGGRLQKYGYHTTPVVGSFGSATAASRILGLSLEEFRHAAAISASLYCGISANNGTMVKPLHAGLANRNGLQSALLAQRGFRANDRLFDDQTGPWHGFLEDYNLAEWTQDIGSHWYAEEGIPIKVYPSCGCTHCAIDAARSIREQLPGEPDPDQIRSIEVYSTPAAWETLRYHDPTTPLEGKFSMEYCVATALSEGNVSRDHFTADAVGRERTKEFKERTTFHADEDMAEGGFVGSGFPARIVVTTSDGVTYEETMASPTGSPDKPISDATLKEKFVECSNQVLTEDEISTVYERLLNIETMDDVGSIMELLAGETA